MVCEQPGTSQFFKYPPIAASCLHRLYFPALLLMASVLSVVSSYACVLLRSVQMLFRGKRCQSGWVSLQGPVRALQEYVVDP